MTTLTRRGFLAGTAAVFAASRVPFETESVATAEPVPQQPPATSRYEFVEYGNGIEVVEVQDIPVAASQKKEDVTGAAKYVEVEYSNGIEWIEVPDNSVS